MASGLYTVLWHPEELGITIASEAIIPLTEGLKMLKENPDFFKQFNPPNGYGSYENFVKTLEELLEECYVHPDGLLKSY